MSKFAMTSDLIRRLGLVDDIIIGRAKDGSLIRDEGWTPEQRAAWLEKVRQRSNPLPPKS